MNNSNRTGMKAVLAVTIFVAVFAIQAVVAGNIERRSVEDDIDKSFRDTTGALHGSTCLRDADCSVISYCKREYDLSPTGQCHMVWWFILVLVLIGLFLLSSIVSCLCCPCCFLYSVGKAICDCLCCCCPSSSRGYSPTRN